MRFLVHVHGLIQALLLFVVRLLFMDVPGLVSNRLFLCGQGCFGYAFSLKPTKFHGRIDSDDALDGC